GSTYAFTLVLLVFLLGIGLGSAVVARRAAAASETAADAALAQGVTAAGAALLFAFFSLLPRYIIAVFQAQSWGASQLLGALGLAIGGVVLVPAIGMGMTFPLLTDLVAAGGTARGEDVGRAYALNTLGSIAGAVLTGFVLVVALGTDVTLRLGLVVSAAAALALAALAAPRVAAGSAPHRRLRPRRLRPRRHGHRDHARTGPGRGPPASDQRAGDRLRQRRDGPRAGRHAGHAARARRGDRARGARDEPLFRARQRHRAGAARRLGGGGRRAQRAATRPRPLRRDLVRAEQYLAGWGRDALHA